MKGSELRDLSDQIRQSKQADAVLLGSVDDGRAYLVVNLDSALVERGADAVAVIREAAKKIDGGGGGRPVGRILRGWRRHTRSGSARSPRQSSEDPRSRLRLGANRRRRLGSTGTIANPVGVVERAATEAGLAQLAALVEAEEVERVVVGLPLTLRGVLRGEQVDETELRDRLARYLAGSRRYL